MMFTSARLAVLLAATILVVGCTARPDSGGSHEASLPKPGTQKETLNKPTDQLTVDLRQAVNRFIEAADQSDVATITSMYDAHFVNIRVPDEGTVVRLECSQLLSIFSRAGGHHIPTKSTTIHHIEVVGDTGFVLLTRIKDLGSGWEPMFYSLVWKRHGEEWLLWREFVHQSSLPMGLKENRDTPQQRDADDSIGIDQVSGLDERLH